MIQPGSIQSIQMDEEQFRAGVAADEEIASDLVSPSEIDPSFLSEFSFVHPL